MNEGDLNEGDLNDGDMSDGEVSDGEVTIVRTSSKLGPWRSHCSTTSATSSSE
jgi:hypothetical protein